MAKERSNTTAEAEAVPKKEKKQKQPTRAGAVFGSILLFLLTLLFGICFLCSSILNSVLPQKTLSAAIAKMDLSQIQLSDHGKEQLIGKCLYDWYFWDAPNLTEEYAEKLLTIYDMCKAVDKGMELGEIHLERKSGGKSGLYIRAEGGYV